MASSESSVLYLEKGRLFFYDGEKIHKLDFTPDIVSDLDVVSEEALTETIFRFVDSAKISPSRFVLVLADSVVFAMETYQSDGGKVEAEFQGFIDTVPFDSVLAKKYRGRNSVEMVATNGELVEVICDSFEGKGFAKDAVVPAFIFGINFSKNWLDEETAKRILASDQQIQGKSMTEATILPIKEGVFRVTAGGPNKTLPLLIGLFAFALVVLLALIFLRR